MVVASGAEGFADYALRLNPVRFAVGDPFGASSNTWRIWAHGDSVYIACRDNYQEVKVSLHPTKWTMGITKEAVEKRPHIVAKHNDRAWERWDPPAEIAPGVVCALRIIFIHSELALTASERVGRAWKETVFVDCAPDSEMTIASIFLSDHERDLRRPNRPSFPLASFSDNTQVVQVVLHGEQLDEPTRFMMTSAIRASLSVKTDRPMPETSRMLFFGAQTDGSRFLVEANYHRPKNDPLLPTIPSIPDGVIVPTAKEMKVTDLTKKRFLRST